MKIWRNILSAFLMIVVSTWFLSDFAADLEQHRIPFGAPPWLHLLMTSPLLILVCVQIWLGRNGGLAR